MVPHLHSLTPSSSSFFLHLSFSCLKSFFLSRIFSELPEKERERKSVISSQDPETRILFLSSLSCLILPLLRCITAKNCDGIEYSGITSKGVQSPSNPVVVTCHYNDHYVSLLHPWSLDTTRTEFDWIKNLNLFLERRKEEILNQDLHREGDSTIIKKVRRRKLLLN